MQATGTSVNQYISVIFLVIFKVCIRLKELKIRNREYSKELKNKEIKDPIKLSYFNKIRQFVKCHKS